MLDLAIADNIDDVVGLLSAAERRHLPFAAARALNVTVAEGQKELRRQLPDRFTIRRDWVGKGIRVKVATKRRLEALLFTLDWFMEQQEAGGTRRTRGGGPRYVPTLRSREGGTIKGEVVAPRGATLVKIAAKSAAVKRRRRGLQKARGRRLAFIPPRWRTKRGHKGLFVRVGDERLPIVLLYTLAEAVAVPPRWGFEGTVTDVSDKTLRRAFLESLEQALATDKRGPLRNWAVSYLLEHGDRALGRAAPPRSVAASLVRGATV